MSNSIHDALSKLRAKDKQIQAETPVEHAANKIGLGMTIGMVATAAAAGLSNMDAVVQQYEHGATVIGNILTQHPEVKTIVAATIGGIAASIVGIRFLESLEKSAPQAVKVDMASYEQIFENIRDTNQVLFHKADLDPKAFLLEGLKTDIDSQAILRDYGFSPNSPDQMLDLCMAYHSGVKEARESALQAGKPVTLNPFKNDAYSDRLISDGMQKYLENKGYSVEGVQGALVDMGTSALQAIKGIQVERHAKRQLEQEFAM